MPTYVYQCESCGSEQEAFQKMSDAPLTVCETCKQPALRRKLTPAGFQLKGSGWYVTDFRDKGNAKAAAKKPDEAKADGGEASAKPAGGDAAAPAAVAPAPAAAPAAGPPASGGSGPKPA